jgi:hypothetical protein
MIRAHIAIRIGRITKFAAVSLSEIDSFKCQQRRWHARCGAKEFFDFAGWEMPVQYSGVIEEHRQALSIVEGLLG